MSKSIVVALAAVVATGLLGCGTRSSGPAVSKDSTVPAGDRSPLLAASNPAGGFNIYLDGFHPMLEDPSQQVEAHHYCNQRNPDFAQCVIFDSSSKDANLVGIEYIISETMFTTLSADDQKDWHPHNGEILSGQLTAPGLGAAAEHQLMQSKMNSYGKTWHFWSTEKGQKLPTGNPMLAWSFNTDGQIRPGLVSDRDSRLGVNTANIRQQRQDLVQTAHPQSGVNRLRGAFGRPETPIPGVQDSNPK